jgi:hypothetical protein
MVPNWQLGSCYRKISNIDSATFASVTSAISSKSRNSSGALVFEADKSFLILTPREFDSEHYGVSMWRVSAFCVESPSQISELLKQVENARKKNKIDFISLEIDETNQLLSDLLESFGYYKVVTKVSNIFYQADRSSYTPLNALFEIRNAKQQDWEQIRELAVLFAPLPTLERDPQFVSIAKNCNRSVYLKWIDKFASGEWSDAAFVAVRHSEIKGLVAFRFDRLFKEITGRLLTDGSSVGFSTNDGTGAYVNIMDRVPDFLPQVEGFVCETTSENHLVLKYCRKRNLQHLGNRIVFHRVYASE